MATPKTTNAALEAGQILRDNKIEIIMGGGSDAPEVKEAFARKIAEKMPTLSINVPNPAGIQDFETCDGFWYALAGFNSEEKSVSDVEEQIEAELTQRFGFPVKAQVFHSNGHAITGDLPTEGSFLVTRL